MVPRPGKATARSTCGRPRELVHDELRAVRGRGDQAGRRVPQDGRQAVAAPQDESREGDGRTHPRRSAQDSRVLKHIALAMRE